MCNLIDLNLEELAEGGGQESVSTWLNSKLTICQALVTDFDEYFNYYKN